MSKQTPVRMRFQPGDRVLLYGDAVYLGITGYRGRPVMVNTEATVLYDSGLSANKVRLDIDCIESRTHVVAGAYRCRLALLKRADSTEQQFYERSDVRIGSRLKIARAQANMKREQLAKLAGTYAWCIKKYETDAEKPDYGMLCLFASALGTTTSELIGPMPEEDEDEDPPFVPTEEELSLLGTFRQLSRNGCKEAIRRIGELARLPEYQKQDPPEASDG